MGDNKVRVITKFGGWGDETNEIIQFGGIIKFGWSGGIKNVLNLSWVVKNQNNMKHV